VWQEIRLVKRNVVRKCKLQKKSLSKARDAYMLFDKN